MKLRDGCCMSEIFFYVVVASWCHLESDFRYTFLLLSLTLDSFLNGAKNRDGLEFPYFDILEAIFKRHHRLARENLSLTIER